MKPEKGKLYLIPATLGDTPPEQVLPVLNLNLLQHIDVYVVEELKTARRFLRKCGYRKDFDTVTEFFRLNEHTSETETETPDFFRKRVVRQLQIPDLHWSGSHTPKAYKWYRYRGPHRLYCR